MYGGQQGNAQYPARPQQQQQPPFRAGLGAGAGLPATPQFQSTGLGTSFIPAVHSWSGEKFSLFVGGIAGVNEGWLERILSTVGPILSLRRPSPPFAFVEYSEPESVLRCLEIVNGLKLSMASGEEKTLLIKADEKNRARLDEYEKTRITTDTMNELTLQAIDDLAAIVTLIATGEAANTTSLSGSGSNPTRGAAGGGPSHLQDLAPEDLPEESRVVITSEIASFRDRSAKREEEKRQAELRTQSRVAARGAPNGPAGYRSTGTASGQQQYQQGYGPRGIDPQSYNQPIGFVPAGTSSGSSNNSSNHGASTSKEPVVVAPVVEIDLEAREKDRIAAAEREAEAMFRDKERRFEGRERGRINNAERERARERALAENEDRDRVVMRERLAAFDDDAEVTKGRDLFYSDRNRWRSQRRPFRAREQEGDARDAAAEAHQMAILRKESEAFLERQADMFNKIAESKVKAGGLPMMKEEDAGVKLSFGVTVVPKPVAKVGVASRRTLLGAEEDEASKKKRALIPLNYSDEEGEDAAGKGKGKSKLTPAEREKKEKALMELVPTTRESVWSYPIEWSAVSEALLVRKLGPFTNLTIVEYLGVPEAELFDAVLEHLRAHKSAAALVEELEPVLDEEATEFVTKIWKRVIYEIFLVQAGLNL